MKFCKKFLLVICVGAFVLIAACNENPVNDSLEPSSLDSSAKACQLFKKYQDSSSSLAWDTIRHSGSSYYFTAEDNADTTQTVRLYYAGVQLDSYICKLYYKQIRFNWERHGSAVLKVATQTLGGKSYDFIYCLQEGEYCSEGNPTQQMLFIVDSGTKQIVHKILARPGKNERFKRPPKITADSQSIIFLSYDDCHSPFVNVGEIKVRDMNNIDYYLCNTFTCH